MTSDFYCDEALSGRTPIEVVSGTARVLAFRHTRPFWPEHIVVIPREHVPSLVQVEPPLLAELLEVVRAIAADVLARHGACRVLTNLGDYQDSKHVHWHVATGEPLR